MFRASYLPLIDKCFLLRMICELLDVPCCLTAQADKGCSEKGDGEHFPEQVNESWKPPQWSTEPWCIQLQPPQITWYLFIFCRIILNPEGPGDHHLPLPKDNFDSQLSAHPDGRPLRLFSLLCQVSTMLLQERNQLSGCYSVASASIIKQTIILPLPVGITARYNYPCG